MCRAAQGGVETKVGNIYASVASRALGRVVYNFGFSGNGQMEVAVGEFLAAVTPPPAAFVIDCSWNMNAAMITANAVPFVSYLRAHGLPETLVVFAEGSPAGDDWVSASAAAFQAESNAALRAAYGSLAAAGDAHLGYVATASLFGPAALRNSATAEGLHPVDAGHHDMGAAFAAALGAAIEAHEALAGAARVL